MLRKLVLLLAALPLDAAILPEQIGEFVRGDVGPIAIVGKEEPYLYQEFNYIATEHTRYSAPGRRFTVTVWRLGDSTSALAMFDMQRPFNATTAKLTALSVKTPDGALFAYGNYVFRISEVVPAQAFPEQKDLEMLFMKLPQLDQTPLPALAGYLPKDGLIPNSERYILGPASLARFEPRIAPSLAAFHLGVEAQLGRYRTPKGDLTLVIFNYPTPNIARERQEEYLKVPGTIAKRSGPLVGVVVQPPDKDAAERVLAEVRYGANLTLNERVPVNQVPALAKLVLNIFTLSGILIALSIIVGVGFGGFRVLLRKLGKTGTEEPFLQLRLRDK